MKTIWIILLLMAPFSASSAQDTDTAGDDEESLPEQQTRAPENRSGGQQMNFGKVNLSSFVVKNISVQYERVINRELSVALGFRLMPRSGIPFRGTLEDIAANDSPEGQALLHEATVGGFAITPEIRYYFGAGYGKGFYLAPFLRYERRELESTYIFTAPDNTMYRLGFSGVNNAWGVGIMVGSQFRLSNNIYLDWWIAGPYYNHHSLNLDAGGFAITTEEAGILDAELRKIDLLNLNMQTKVTTTTANLKAGGNLFAFRGLGLCLSFRF